MDKKILDKYFLVEITEDSEPNVLGWKVVGIINSALSSFHVRTTKDGWLDVFDIKCLPSSGVVIANYPDEADFYIEELKDFIDEINSKELTIAEKDLLDLFNNKLVNSGPTWTTIPYTVDDTYSCGWSNVTTSTSTTSANDVYNYYNYTTAAC